MDFLKRLKEADQNPEALETHFASLGPMPMGRYFEQLLIYGLKQDPNYRLLAANEQIIVDKKTLGEIDLILENTRSGERQHWEVALKFYLQTAPKSDYKYFLGPSEKDHLARKMKALFKRQLALGEHPQISQQFGKLSPKLFLKGQLFYTIGREKIRAQNWNPKAQAGTWLNIKALESSPLSEARYFHILQKPEWMAPYYCSSKAGLLSPSTLIPSLVDKFAETRRPQLVVILEKEAEVYLEKERFFVSPQNWPSSIVSNN